MASTSGVRGCEEHPFRNMPEEWRFLDAALLWDGKDVWPQYYRALHNSVTCSIPHPRPPLPKGEGEIRASTALSRGFVSVNSFNGCDRPSRIVIGNI